MNLPRFSQNRAFTSLPASLKDVTWQSNMRVQLAERTRIKRRAVAPEPWLHMGFKVHTMAGHMVSPPRSVGQLKQYGLPINQ